MMKILPLFLLFVALGSKQLVFSQLEEARRITQQLCSESFFGRGYVKSGDSLAAEFLKSEFEKRGLKPLQKSFFQCFNFEVNTFPGKMNLTINGKSLVTAVDFMVDPSSGSSSKSWKPKIISSAEIFDAVENQKLYSELKKTNVINSVVIDLRELKNDSLKKARSLAYSLVEMCDVLVITNEKFTFSVGREQFPNALIYVQGKSVSSIDQVETNIESVFNPKHTARNVIAMLPAKKKTKETIVFSAHYDHLGGMGKEVFFPGGNDNASGTSMLFFLADYFTKNPVPYNLVFMAFAGEEAGLIGSKYYTENPLFKLSDIKFLLNLDIMGSGEDGVTVVNATLFPKEFDLLVAINENEKLLKQIKKRGPAANSDHYFFTEKGVPAFFIYTMGDNKHYHDVEDTYEALTFNEYLDITRLIAAFVKGV